MIFSVTLCNHFWQFCRHSGKFYIYGCLHWLCVCLRWPFLVLCVCVCVCVCRVRYMTAHDTGVSCMAFAPEPWNLLLTAGAFDPRAEGSSDVRLCVGPFHFHHQKK